MTQRMYKRAELTVVLSVEMTSNVERVTAIAVMS